MTVLSLLLEGFESALLPCSLVVLVPGMAVAMAARGRLLPPLVGFSGASVLLAWLRFSDRGGAWPIGVAAVALIVAAVLFTVPLIDTDDISFALGGSLAGAAAAELWEPCVGAEFGLLLNELPDAGPTGALRMLVFMVGVLSPVAGFVALLKLLPEWILHYVQPTLAIIGASVLAIMAVATAMGLHDEITGRLIRWSL